MNEVNDVDGTNNRRKRSSNPRKNSTNATTELAPTPQTTGQVKERMRTINILAKHISGSLSKSNQNVPFTTLDHSMKRHHNQFIIF